MELSKYLKIFKEFCNIINKDLKPVEYVKHEDGVVFITESNRFNEYSCHYFLVCDDGSVKIGNPMTLDVDLTKTKRI